MPSPRFTPSKSEDKERLSPHFKISKVDAEYDRIIIWGTLDTGEAIQLGISKDTYESQRALFTPGKWVEAKGISVTKKKEEPFYYSKISPHRLKAEFKEWWSDDVADFEDAFFDDQKCQGYGINHDNLDTDCTDCMFGERCKNLTKVLGNDISAQLLKSGKKRASMINKVPFWRDNRPIYLIGMGLSGEVLSDGIHHCKVCNGKVRIIVMSEGQTVWKYWNNNMIEIEKLICPHCQVGVFKVEVEAKSAQPKGATA
jgi:hypothetical protein